MTRARPAALAALVAVAAALAASVALLAPAAPGRADQPVPPEAPGAPGDATTFAPEPDDYHGEPYLGAVPRTLAGARVISTPEAIAAHDRGVPFIDVLPRQRRPEGLPEGTIWNARPHLTIPGAMWLADTGYQRLAPAEQARLEAGLARASRGDRDAPMVIFCKAMCWMSWNAARRAVALGYRGVMWYPEGVDGWLQAGLPLEPAEPADP